jgi:large subunit ribosomal protein L6
MSRIGKKAVAIPSGVTAEVSGQTVSVKGPKGTLSYQVHDLIGVEKTADGIKVTPLNETKAARSQWGTSRTRILNLVEGVSKGFEKKLEINGVGYKAAMEGTKSLTLSLGYSHDIHFPVPEGITIAVSGAKGDQIVVSGIDKQKVGQTAAEIREWRGPEPYKGKGVKYATETIFRKEGKKK